MWCGLHSLLAPTSKSSVGRPDLVGSMAASAGRSTPGSMPSTIFAVAIAAPVLPAETKPSACPSATSRARLRFLLDLQNLAAVVVAALRADAVRLARLLAVLARDGLRRAQRVVRAALARARLGMASFRIRHLITPRLMVNGK